jgi:UDP-N-acetylglucosamine 4,6-dehydratase/5-epimerase
MAKQQTLLITGGTGTLGTALVKRFYDTHNIVVFSRDEHKHEKLKKQYPRIKSFIGDVRDYERVKQAVAFADVVIHAGAMKIVPECEYHPYEAIMTNVIGSLNVLRAFEQSDGKMLIGVSTDKACHCINLYGATKYTMEKLYVNSTSDKHISCVRYGNVCASTGSVIPIWIEAIKQKTPIKITVPMMTRFMLSIDSAVDLLEFAMNRVTDKEIIIPNLKSIRMDRLAEGLMRMFGKTKVEIIGERPGEKIHEQLVNDDELYRTENIGTHYIIHKDAVETPVHQHYSSFDVAMNDDEIDTFLHGILRG